MARAKEVSLPDEFASTMQQLVAEAEKAVPRESIATENGEPMRDELTAMTERLTALEETIAAGFEKLAAPPERTELNERLQRLDDHIFALRNTETVNQRLFNSLHQELKSYRDNFLRESLQKPFIRDLVMLYDDLSSLAEQMHSAGGGKPAIVQWSANLDNALHALIEVLHRMEVTQIEPKEMLDRTLHRVVSFEPAEFAEDDGRIVMRLKRGFVWRDQVLRPEEVVVKRFS